MQSRVIRFTVIPTLLLRSMREYTTSCSVDTKYQAVK